MPLGNDDLDDNYDALFKAAGQKWGVDPILLKLQAQQESSLNPKATGPETSYGQAQGISQLLPSTAKSVGVSDPYDPAQAIDGQAQLMAQNLKKYGNTQDALAAYHGGPNQALWGPKTKDYVQKISAAYEGARPKMAGLPSDNLDDIQAFSSEPAASSLGLPSDDLDNFSKQDHASNPSSNYYIDAKGVMRSKYEQSPELVNDLGKFAAGTEEGIKDVPRSLAAPLTYGYDKLTGDNASNYLANETAFRNNQLVQQYGDSGLFNAGRVAGNVIGATPLMLGGEGAAALPINALTRASPEIAQFLGEAPAAAKYLAGIGRGTAEGYEAGGLTSANSNLSPSDAAGTGAEVGAALSTLGPAARVGGRFIGNALTGGTIDPEIAKLAQVASDKYGIQIPGGQLSDNPIMNRTYSLLNRFGLTGKNDGAGQITTALANEMGGGDIAQAAGNRLTNDALDKIGDRIGSKLDDAAARVNQLGGIKADKPFTDQLDDLAQRATDSGAPIDGVISRIKGAIHNDELTGDQYQKLIAKGQPLWNVMHSSDPTKAALAGEARELLDSALENSTNDPAIKKQIQQARYQYKVYANFGNLAEKNNGIVPPTSIFNIAKNKFGGNIKSARNAGNIGELGQIGQQFALDPSSGTAENLLLTKAAKMMGIAGVSGAEGSLLMYNPILAAKAAATLGTAAGLGRGVGAYLSSNALRNSIIDRSLQQGQLPAKSAITNALNPGLLTSATYLTNQLSGLPSSQ